MNKIKKPLAFALAVLITVANLFAQTSWADDGTEERDEKLGGTCNINYVQGADGEYYPMGCVVTETCRYDQSTIQKCVQSFYGNCIQGFVVNPRVVTGHCAYWIFFCSCDSP